MKERELLNFPDLDDVVLLSPAQILIPLDGSTPGRWLGRPPDADHASIVPSSDWASVSSQSGPIGTSLSKMLISL